MSPTRLDHCARCDRSFEPSARRNRPATLLDDGRIAGDHGWEYSLADGRTPVCRRCVREERILSDSGLRLLGPRYWPIGR